MITIRNYTKVYTDEFVTDTLSTSLSYLSVDDVEVVVTVDDAFLDKMGSADVEYEGILVPTQLPHSYLLRLRDLSEREMRRVLAHEAVHINQQELGDLRVEPLTLECWWKGKKYNNSYPYMDRPWEREAFKKQSEILKALTPKEDRDGCLFGLLKILVLWMH